ncbi:arylsulfatase [Brachybacterium saurashtrense]|uniref:Arylsulfatase n=1 Tax=Brachybacterium saurashtrense TaxID=556288 RepID=A0A345YRM6_9MICO|nr:arylsulfatase [Brachybacterium saurashtrense]AXK46578.1 arylsulfatase [Brachybacterium saurashtrense]RRR24319.1 arylsulfatase [Brachybacterium saurashtrense]
MSTDRTPAWPDRTNLPIPPLLRQGRVERTVRDSDPPQWPQEVAAPAGAPNVLLVMTDDVGFGATEPFGGPIPTPTYSRLAEQGLKYNRFHTTALCSPTRAALITGRNHHVASTGIIMEFSTPFAGYHSIVSRSCGTIGEILTRNGYGTGWFGKNHNVPDWLTTPAGPFDLWPSGLGFEYFYGFLGADAHQFRPAVHEGTQPVEPYLDDEDYHLDADLADRAITWIRRQKAVNPDKPFFAYYTPGTAHVPHHAPAEWREKFRGQFDHGWDEQRRRTFERQKELGIIPEDSVLNPTPDHYRRWDDLSEDMQRVCARQMECYAAALSHADHQVGRVVDAVEQLGELENTLIIYIQGDNGSSAEDPTGHGFTSEIGVLANDVVDTEEYMIENIDEFGGMWLQNHFSHGWAHAMNSPYQWDKKIASHLGGSRTSAVVSWPARIHDTGGLRSQFTHVTDIVPTILEAAGIPMPDTIDGIEQVPLNGTSMMPFFDAPDAPESHTTQYFEVIANQGIYHEGWMANTAPKRLPWVGTGESTADPFDEYEWELYDLTTDFTQSRDVAAEHPEKLEEMRQLFLAEARANQVLPLDDRYIERLAPENRPPHNVGRTHYVYYPGVSRITEAMAPQMKNTSYRITADLTVPEGGAEGMLMCQGGWFGGNALYLLDGRPTFAYARSHYPEHKYVVRAEEPLAPGRHRLVLDFAWDGGAPGAGGTATLSVDDREIASGRIDETIPVRVSADETFDVGEDTGTPVVREYDVPFRFTGALSELVVDVLPAS